jgi:hypothetical protein
MCRAVDAGDDAAEPTAVRAGRRVVPDPLVPQLLGEALGRDVTVAVDPVGAVATGGACWPAASGARVRRRSAPHGRSRARPVRPRRRPPCAARGVAAGRQGGPRGRRRRGARRPAAPGDTAARRGRRAAGHGAAAARGGRPARRARRSHPCRTDRTAVCGRPARRHDGAPVARPPKQARPFTAGLARPRRGARGSRSSRPHASLALARAGRGGGVRLRARLGAGHRGGAVTPVSVVGRSTSAVRGAGGSGRGAAPPAGKPARRRRPPPGRPPPPPRGSGPTRPPRPDHDQPAAQRPPRRPRPPGQTSTPRGVGGNATRRGEPVGAERVRPRRPVAPQGTAGTHAPGDRRRAGRRRAGRRGPLGPAEAGAPTGSPPRTAAPRRSDRARGHMEPALPASGGRHGPERPVVGGDGLGSGRGSAGEAAPGGRPGQPGGHALAERRRQRRRR